jgi:ferredoxin--NADP+ reductase
MQTPKNSWGTRLNPSELDETVEVISIKHWSKNLFSFRLQRPKSFRFNSGEFILLGLADYAGKSVLRAYSIASPSWDDTLLFYSISVEDGPLTSMLSKIKKGNGVILKRKPTGTLVLNALRPGKKLFLFATGTGIAPFASLIRAPLMYENFTEIVLVHTCRMREDLAFGQFILELIKKDCLLKESDIKRLKYFPTLTREKFVNEGRITDLITSGVFFREIGILGFCSESDRAMICGSLDFNKEMKTLLLNAGLAEGSINDPGDFVLERAFVG